MWSRRRHSRSRNRRGRWPSEIDGLSSRRGGPDVAVWRTAILRAHPLGLARCNTPRPHEIVDHRRPPAAAIGLCCSMGTRRPPTVRRARRAWCGRPSSPVCRLQRGAFGQCPGLLLSRVVDLHRQRRRAHRPRAATVRHDEGRVAASSRGSGVSVPRRFVRPGHMACRVRKLG